MNDEAEIQKWLARVKRYANRFGKDLAAFMNKKVKTKAHAEGMAWCLISASIACLSHRFNGNKAMIRDSLVRAINHMLE